MSSANRPAELPAEQWLRPLIGRLGIYASFFETELLAEEVYSEVRCAEWRRLTATLVQAISPIRQLLVEETRCWYGALVYFHQQVLMAYTDLADRASCAAVYQAWKRTALARTALEVALGHELPNTYPTLPADIPEPLFPEKRATWRALNDAIDAFRGAQIGREFVRQALLSRQLFLFLLHCAVVHPRLWTPEIQREVIALHEIAADRLPPGSLRDRVRQRLSVLQVLGPTASPAQPTGPGERARATSPAVALVAPG